MRTYRSGGGSEGGAVRAVKGGGGWAWTGACKTLLFMAGALEGGGGASASGGGGEGSAGGDAFHGKGAGGGGASASGGGMDWEPALEPLKPCFSWPGRKTLLRSGGGGEGGVGGVGGGGWAWTGAVKPCFSWQARWRGGRQVRAVGAVGAVRAVWAVWAVRAVGVGHGLEPVKHCFSW